MGKVKVEGSLVHVLPSPGQEAVSFDLQDHDVPILDAWPWTTNAIILSGLAILIGMGAWLLGSRWGWGGSALVGVLLLRSAALSLRPTPVIRLFRDGIASDVRLDATSETDFLRLSRELSSVHGALGFASSSLPGIPPGAPLDGLLYVLTHERPSQSLPIMKRCYRQAVAQIRAGEFAPGRSIHFLIKRPAKASEQGEAFKAALHECEEWSETGGQRVVADCSLVDEL